MFYEKDDKPRVDPIEPHERNEVWHTVFATSLTMRMGPFMGLEIKYPPPPGVEPTNSALHERERTAVQRATWAADFAQRALAELDKAPKPDSAPKLRRVIMTLMEGYGGGEGSISEADVQRCIDKHVGR